MHPEALTEQGKGIFPRLAQFSGFYLAGGTALALQIGHRVSVDFDLFSDHAIEKTLFDQVKKVYADFPVNPSVNNADELTVFVGDAKLTFLHYPFPVLLDTAVEEGVKMLSVPELAATKAYTIGRRGSYRDYIDLYFVIAEKFAKLEEIIRLAEQKYSDAFNGRLFLEQLMYLNDIENTEIHQLRGAPVDKTSLENFFTEEIKKITL